MESLCNCLSKYFNIFCCKNRTAEINPPTINRDNKPVFVNEKYENEENETYLKYIKFKDIDTKKHTYSNYDEFDYNQPLPDVPEVPQLFNKQIKQEIKQEIIYNTNLVFSNTDNNDIIIPPPLPPKINRNTKSSILFH
jgi:hypothetical protein